MLGPCDVPCTHMHTGLSHRAAARGASQRERTESVASQANQGTLPFEAVVHIANCAAVPDLTAPWKVMDPNSSTGTGFCIGGRRILTNNHVVECSTALRISKHGKPGSFAGRVLCKSDICDLAIVTVDDAAFWRGLPSVRFQGKVGSSTPDAMFPASP